MSPKGRTELIIGVSEAKLHEETDFDIQKSLTPRKPGQKREKLISETEKKRCGKIKCGESSETRFGKVSWACGPCLRGKRPFKVTAISFLNDLSFRNELALKWFWPFREMRQLISKRFIIWK